MLDENQGRVINKIADRYKLTKDELTLLTLDEKDQRQLILLHIILYMNIRDPDDAYAWLRSHNQYFNDSPINYIKYRGGYTDVINYLSYMIRNGGIHV